MRVGRQTPFSSELESKTGVDRGRWFALLSERTPLGKIPFCGFSLHFGVRSPDCKVAAPAECLLWTENRSSVSWYVLSGSTSVYFVFWRGECFEGNFTRARAGPVLIGACGLVAWVHGHASYFAFSDRGLYNFFFLEDLRARCVGARAGSLRGVEASVFGRWSAGTRRCPV